MAPENVGRCSWPTQAAPGQAKPLMTSCTFSAQGTRWKVWSITDPGTSLPQVQRRLGPAFAGLYFESSDGESRALAMLPSELQALGDVSTRDNTALGAFVARAAPLPAESQQALGDSR
jgi:hypothetical protein